MKIGILTVSDRASRGEYEDLSGPAIKAYLDATLSTPWTPTIRIVPDGMASVAAAFIEMCEEGAGLILATGGTGPAPRDETPEALASVIEKELPGFGELMRRISLETVPTAILSRQSAGIRGKTLMVTLPGKPAAIKVCLDAVFPAVPYCLELIGAGFVDTDPAVLKAFRPGK
ncbi:MAG TPA: molybdopterin adenylyltransferase [Devosiaceae bacterium]|nr:molybdopterin adenylyltransferase [Devosiaceae bacterium]